MRNATRIFASTFGTIMALAGIEHGIGEVAQGNVAPAGVMILSWPDSPLFRGLGGEPAMTLIPNMLATGIAAILVSLTLLAWATLFVQRKHGGLVMMLLSGVMLLVGGGIFPPVLALVIGAVATQINAPLAGQARHPGAFRRGLGKVWAWAFSACIVSWLALFPGLALAGYFLGVNDPALILAILFCALSSLLLTIFGGFAHDALEPTPYAP